MDDLIIPAEACGEPQHMRGKIECALVAAFNARDTIGQTAQRVLHAMQEPTEAMVIAGVRHENMGDMAGRWRSMIDEALLGN